MTYETNFAAYIIAAAMLHVVVVTQLAASGKIRRNGFVGLRIPPTMVSDAAWVAGHRAARVPSWIGFVLVAIAAGTAQFMPRPRLFPSCSCFYSSGGPSWPPGEGGSRDKLNLALGSLPDQATGRSSPVH
jgi:hypothetical protein